MDSLQLGAAIFEKCDKFLTNDFKLAKINELEVIILDNLPKEK